jgi:4-carboxymuconolactone decarboxylase
MDKQTYETGLRIRAEVLGQDYVDNAIRGADDFNRPFQQFVTEYCWGAIWNREGMTRKMRSLLILAMIGAMNRPHELKIHLRGALQNGATKEDIREVFMMLAIYAGAPAAGDSFRLAREVFAEEAKG